MTDNNDKVNQLHDKLETLLKRQDDFSREINNLRVEINRLKVTGQERTPENVVPRLDKPKNESDFEVVKVTTTTGYRYSQPQTNHEPLEQVAPPVDISQKSKSDLEKFIGENLINKIGIVITVIGVAIGAKYSIENELISPLTRIILGYLAGLGLLGFGIKLKSRYENYSAVLVSGAMAIMYFITYSAYGFYNLIPQVFAFALMVSFTAFTVLAAINYNRQVIAQIGLVGAYAVPFLLSEGTGKVAILFSYMAIINTGILVIAFKKYWKPLYYSSFGLTWLMYFVWYVTKYQTNEHFGLALSFLSVFFITFYLTLLAYKLIQKEKFEIDDIFLLLVNSFIFYGIGYFILDNHKTGEQLLGLFTLFNAIVHFIVGAIIYRQKLADRNLFYLVSGLVLVFITIAIPVQLDGNWVTLLWAGESALLFWIGRTKNVPVYENLSYPLMILAFFSITHDWITLYDAYHPENPETRITPLFNIIFLTSILFIAAFGFINILNSNRKYSSEHSLHNGILKIISFVIPAILIFTIYYAFRMEIETYWEQLYKDSELIIRSNNQQYPDYFQNYDLNKFKTVWVINYSLFFVSLLAFVNFRKLKKQQLGVISLCLIAFYTRNIFNSGTLRLK